MARARVTRKRGGRPARPKGRRGKEGRSHGELGGPNDERRSGPQVPAASGGVLAEVLNWQSSEAMDVGGAGQQL